MDKPIRFLTIGAATQDVFLQNSSEITTAKIDSTHEIIELELGAKVDVNKIDFATGGGATNAAVALSRQGFLASFMGVVGNDVAGRSVLDDLDKENVDTSRVEVSQRYNTDYSTVLLAPDGERTIMTYRGCSSHIYTDSFKLEDGEFDWLYISNMAGRLDSLRNIFDEAHRVGVKIAWNPGKKELSHSDEIKSLLEDVDILVVNKEEAQLLTNGETSEELIHRLSKLVKVIIITDGQNGVWASDGKVIVRAGMYEDVTVVDRTGAGDAFAAGFLSYWVRGADLKQSLLFASANSTSVIQHIGAKKGLLDVSAELHLMPMSEEKL